VANSFERRILGWIVPQVINSGSSQTISNVQLRDYITYGDAVVLEINSSTDEYFYIENHQATSYWETTFVYGNIEPGVYVIRKVGTPYQYDPSWLQLIPADGRYDWTVNQSSTLPGETTQLPVFKQGTVNRSAGYHDNQWIPFNYGGLSSPTAIHLTENSSGQPQVDIRFHGDWKDAFRMDYNQVFTPWSNPNNQRAVNTTTNFGFELTGLNGGVYTMNLYVNTSADAAPSKPQNFAVTVQEGKPRLSWNANTEPDIYNYIIYRNINNAGWSNITTTTNTYYLDSSIDPTSHTNIQYKIKVADTQSKQSVYSEIATLTVNVVNGVTYTQNQTLSGIYYFTSNATVNAGVTLTVQEGTGLYFASGTNLIVNGTLNASGTSTNGIIFTKSGANNWGGIQFNSGSGNLQYCTITYATHGIYCYNSSPTISYSHVQNNQYDGVYCNYYSSPVLDHCTIQNNYTGVSCSDHSSPRLLILGSYPGSNVIRNNGGWGVSASYYSNPAVGTSSYGGGYNSIYSNGGGTSAISANYYCTINANGNWWDGAPTILETNGSSVTALNPLASDPNAGRTRIVSDDSQGIAGMDISLSKQIESDDLSGAQENENNKKYDEAINLYLSVFKNSKDELLSRYILCKIEECFTKGEKKDYLDFSKRELKPIIKEGTETYVVALELETHQMVNAGLYKDAVNNLLTILKKYNLNSDIEKNTLFTLGAFYSLYFGDKDNSDKYFEELKQKYPKDELVNQIGIIKSMGMVPKGSLQNGGMISFSKETISETTKEITEDVVSNYPNPFNPSTQISFTLKESGKVSLKVYDVLGKEVANLADGYYEAGRHTATFDGSSLASGIYFYRLTTPTATITKKMVLTK